MVKTRKMASLLSISHSRVTRSAVKGQRVKMTRNQILRKANSSNNHRRQMKKVRVCTESQLKSKNQLCKPSVCVGQEKVKEPFSELDDHEKILDNETVLPEAHTVNEEIVSNKTVQVVAHDEDQMAGDQDALHGKNVAELGMVSGDTGVTLCKTLKVLNATKSGDEKSSIDEESLQDSISLDKISEDTATMIDEDLKIANPETVDNEKLVQEMVIQETANQKTLSQETVPVCVEKIMHADQEAGTESNGLMTKDVRTSEITGDVVLHDIPVEGNDKKESRSEGASGSANYLDDKEIDEVEPIPDYIREATCTICKKELSSRYSLEVHMKAIHNPAPKKKKPTFDCPFCSKVLSSCYTYRTHIKKFHTEYQDVSVETEDLERKHGHEVSYEHTLVVGNKYSASSESELNGLQSRRGRCNVTSQTSDLDMGDDGNTSVLRDSTSEADSTPSTCHIVINQPEKRKQKVTSRTVKQPNKEETVINKKSGTVILKHAKVTLKLNTGLSGETPVEGVGVDCPFCDKVCDSFTQYRNHLRSHEKKTTQCMECGATFRRKGSLEVHMRIHSNERPYKCEICDATFRHDSSLTFHVRKHRNERNYKCLKCGQTFLSNTCMRKHMRKKCFRGKQLCSKCNKEFKSKASLQKHMLEEHYGRTRRLVLETFPCDECSRLFSSEYSLYRHKSASHGLERPYRCLECRQIYPDMDAAKRHSLEAHYRAAKDAEDFIEDRRVSKDQDEEAEVASERSEEEEEVIIEPEDKTGDPDYLPSAESGEEDSNTDGKSNSGDKESEAPGVAIATVHSIADPYLNNYLEAVKPVVIRKKLPQNATKLEKVLAKYPVLMPRPTLSGPFAPTVGAPRTHTWNGDGCTEEAEEKSLTGNERTQEKVSASDSLEEVAVGEASAGSFATEDRLQQSKEIDLPNETSTGKLGRGDMRRPSVTVTVNGTSYTLPLVVTEEEILATATKTTLDPKKDSKKKPPIEKMKTRSFLRVQKVADCGNKSSRCGDDKEPEIVMQKQQNNPEKEKLWAVLQKRKQNLPKGIPRELQVHDKVTETLLGKQLNLRTKSNRRRKTKQFGALFAFKSSLIEDRTSLSKKTDTGKLRGDSLKQILPGESRQSKVEKLLAQLPVLVPKPVNPLIAGNCNPNVQPLTVSDNSTSTTGSQHQLSDEQSLRPSSINTSLNASPPGNQLQLLSVEGNHISSSTLTGSSTLTNQVQLPMEHFRLSRTENTDESSLRNPKQSSVSVHENNVNTESCPTTYQPSNVSDNHMEVAPYQLQPDSNYEKSMRKAVEVSGTSFYSKSNFQPITDNSDQPANAAQGCTGSSPTNILPFDATEDKVLDDVTQYVESNNEEELPLIITNVISLNPNVREQAVPGNIQERKEKICKADETEVVFSEDIGLSATSLYETNVSEVLKFGKSSDSLEPPKPLHPTRIATASSDSVPLKNGLAKDTWHNSLRAPLRDVVSSHQNSILDKTETDLHNSVQGASVTLLQDERRSSFNDSTTLLYSQPEQILQFSSPMSLGNCSSNKQNSNSKPEITTQSILLSDRVQSTSLHSKNRPLRNTNLNLRNVTPSYVDKIKKPGLSSRRGKKNDAQWNLSRRYRPLLPKPSPVDAHRMILDSPALNNIPFREQVQHYPYSVRNSYLDNRTAEMISSQTYSYERDGESFPASAGRHIGMINQEEVSPHESAASTSQPTGIIHSDNEIQVSSECSMESVVQPFPYVPQQNRDLVQHGSTQQYTTKFKGNSPSSVSHVGYVIKSGFSRSGATAVRTSPTLHTAVVTDSQDQTQPREPGDRPDLQPLSGTPKDLHKHATSVPLEKTELDKTAQSQKYSALATKGKNIMTNLLTPKGYVVLEDSAQESAPAQPENALAVATAGEGLSQEEYATGASNDHEVRNNRGGRSQSAPGNSAEQVITPSSNSHSGTPGGVSRVSVNNHERALEASKSSMSDRCGYGPPDYPSHRESFPSGTHSYQSRYREAGPVSPDHTTTVGYTTPRVAIPQQVSQAYDRFSPQSQRLRYSEARDRVNERVVFPVSGVLGGNNGEQSKEQHIQLAQRYIEPNRKSPPGSPQSKHIKHSIHDSSSSSKKKSTPSRDLEIHLQNFVGRVNLPTYTHYANKLGGRGVRPLLPMRQTQHGTHQRVQGENSPALSFSKRQHTFNHLVVNANAPLADGVLRMPYSYAGSWSPNELANAPRNRFNNEQLPNRTQHLNYMGYIPNQPRPIRQFPTRFSAPEIFQSSNSQTFPPHRLPSSSVAAGFQGASATTSETFQTDSTSTTERSVVHPQSPSTSQLPSTAQRIAPQEPVSYVSTLNTSSAPQIVSVKSEYESPCQCTSSAAPAVSIKSKPSPEVPSSVASIKFEKESTDTYTIHDLLRGIKVELNSEKTGSKTAFVPFLEHKKSIQTQAKISSDRGRSNSVYRFLQRAIACIPLVGSSESANS